MIRKPIAVAFLFAFASCGSAAAGGSVAGTWSEETGSDKPGMTLELDADSDKVLVHTAPDEHGHDHLSGTYSCDAAGAVTIRCKLAGETKGDVWQGKVDGDHLVLTAGATTLRFHQGGDPHEHK